MTETPYDQCGACGEILYDDHVCDLDVDDVDDVPDAADMRRLEIDADRARQARRESADLASRLAASFTLEARYLMSRYGEAQGSYRLTLAEYEAQYDALHLPTDLTESSAVQTRIWKASPDDFARMGDDLALCGTIVGEWQAYKGGDELTTERRVWVPGQLFATFRDGEIVEWVFTPHASDAGYFGPAADVVDGQPLDVESTSGPFWRAVQDNLDTNPFPVRWSE